MRLPTKEETNDLLDFHVNRTYKDPTPEDYTEEALYLKNIWYAVFDDYITDCPGYAGRVMVVVWGGSPSYTETFIWDSNKLIQKVENEL